MQKRRMASWTWKIGVLALALTGCGGEPSSPDGFRPSVSALPEDISGNVLPDGVVDGNVNNESSDADGFCYSPESGYFPCDDGAPPGSGPTNPGDTDPGSNDPGGGGPGDTDPGGSGPGGNATPICFSQTFLETDNETPQILLVVDKSGSMNDEAVGYAGSKWSGAVNALNNVVTALDDTVAFGLMLYPNGDADNNVCQQGNMRVDVGVTHGTDIVGALNNAGPGGGTPTAQTLLSAGQALRASAQEAPAAVILATDGGPNCNGALNPQSCRCVDPDGCDDGRNCLDDSNSVAAAQQLNADGIPVFVVGIPGSENFTDVLSALSTAGGTALPGAQSFYQANDSAALSSAVEEIAVRVGSCRFDLDHPVNDVGEMSVTMGGIPMPHVPSHQMGWDLVDADTVEVFGATCTQLLNSPVPVTIDYCWAPAS